ncbi:MAG TPA: CotS family spore coat protein [Bacillota bacterium]|nr:CotS family spore coat protein [Bacillota bacterium]
MGRQNSDKVAENAQRMTTQEITDLLSDYDLVVDGAEEQAPGIWRLITDGGLYCLHVVNFSRPRLLFIHSVMEHLAKKGYKNTPRMIRNKHGEAFSCPQPGTAVYLTEWHAGRPFSFSRTDQAVSICRLLARLHLHAVDFVPLQGSLNLEAWGQWPEKLRHRKEEIRLLAGQIDAKEHHSKAERNFLSNLSYFLEQADKALEILDSEEYYALVNREKAFGALCFRDIGTRNVKRQDGDLNITSLDYAICDLRIYDLAKLLQRACGGTNWNWEKAFQMLKEYEEIRPLSPEEKKVLLALITFPRYYWLYAKKYLARYLSTGDASGDMLKKVIKCEGDRVEFLNRLNQYVYN